MLNLVRNSFSNNTIAEKMILFFTRVHTICYMPPRKDPNFFSILIQCLCFKFFYCFFFFELMNWMPHEPNYSYRVFSFRCASRIKNTQIDHFVPKIYIDLTKDIPDPDPSLNTKNCVELFLKWTRWNLLFAIYIRLVQWNTAVKAWDYGLFIPSWK